jgi:GH43 family beta-xylosidase
MDSKGRHPAIWFTGGNAEITEPGHNSVTISPDGRELFIVYDIHTGPWNPGGDRQVRIDRMGFREDGSLIRNRSNGHTQLIPFQE